ncbi:MAG: hypothetical protein MJ088_00390 [Clostridia bacterium]|nr:hypothetical protein [Clostridia bacterium]
MKKILRAVSFCLVFALFFGSIICIAGETVKVTKDVYQYSNVPAPEETGIFSEMNSFLPSAGLKVSYLANHGGGQTRMVYTKTGLYYALFTGEDGDAPNIGIDLIHMNDDGTATSVFHTEQPFNPSGPMVSVMADKDGTIWMYAGWQVGDGGQVKFQFLFNMWRYDPATGEVKLFSKQQLYKTSKICMYGSGGYSSCALDEENGRIFAIVNCCDKPGYIEWALFDMNTCEWSEMRAIKLDYRYCYSYILPDGKGGFHIFGERDVVVESIKTDNGKNVASAARSLHSCWYDNNMLFDEWDYFHLPDPTVEEFDAKYPVEPATYEVEKGLYPDNRSNSSDIFMDSKGYLHFVYKVGENIEYGDRVVHVVYDVSNGAAVEIRRQKMEFAASSKAPYYCRCYEDTEGNFYLVCTRSGLLPVEFEIWGTSDPTAELGLLWAEYRVVGEKTSAGSAAATSRNGSIMGDVMHWVVNTDENLWYDMTVDFAKLRAFIGR